MGIREHKLLFLCLLMPTIYCGKITGYLLSTYNWDYMFPNTTGHFERPSMTSSTSVLAGTTHRHISRLPDTHSSIPYVNINQESSHPTRKTLLKNLALAVIYKNMIRKRGQQGRVSAVALNNYVLPDMSKRHYRKHVDGNIEVLVIVDNSIFKDYLIKSQYSVQDAKQKIYQYYNILFAMTRREVGWLEYISRWSDTRSSSVLNASRALRRFQKWLRRNKYLPNFDHAVLFTSYILSKKRKQIDGLAYVGTMCEVESGKSSSIVQDTGDFQSAGVIAHELAHSLGVSHDGEGVNSVCSASKNYVMAPQSLQDVRVASNNFYFSPCSVKQLKKFVTSTKAKCLYNTPKASYTYDLKKKPPGKLFDEDAQCQLAFGSSSQFCDQGSRRSDVCSRLWCTSPDENEFTCRSSNRLIALPGTSCGYGQHCHLGQCVVSYMHMIYQSPIPFRDENCPMGDGNPASCRNIIENSPYLCDRERLKQYCCESCGKLGHSAARYFRRR